VTCVALGLLVLAALGMLTVRVDSTTRRLNLVHTRTGERAITREQALERVYLAVKDIDAARKELVSRAATRGVPPRRQTRPPTDTWRTSSTSSRRVREPLIHRRTEAPSIAAGSPPRRCHELPPGRPECWLRATGGGSQLLGAAASRSRGYRQGGWQGDAAVESGKWRFKPVVDAVPGGQRLD
jgi:hypothetical protein